MSHKIHRGKHDNMYIEATLFFFLVIYFSILGVIVGFFWAGLWFSFGLGILGGSFGGFVGMVVAVIQVRTF